MSESEKIFEEEFESLKNDLANKYRELGMKASGEWEAELEVEAGDDFGRVIGLPYTEQLEKGREPTSRGGDGSLLKRIEKWIIDKGIVASIEGDISISSLAYLITRKIHREGWRRENYGGVELVSSVVTPKRMQGILNRLGETLTIEFSNKIEKEIRTIVV